MIWFTLCDNCVMAMWRLPTAMDCHGVPTHANGRRDGVNCGGGSAVPVMDRIVHAHVSYNVGVSSPRLLVPPRTKLANYDQVAPSPSMDRLTKTS